ncbi:amidohydrolase [Hoyosella altamirensis]|uniref:Amidohydrolase n=2 Tax=Hoyosella altamirensis TaxID=616997 RepID=A0A839RHA2_9ACTN|nr:M20 family metallopeptidase [Hoyosella altamirensis]MBB3035584.1 amidohydrolase [Hoyosella altamirensis]
MREMIGKWLVAHRDDLVRWRRELHRHPELARAEFRTTAFVEDHFKKAGLNPVRFPGGTGLYCDLGPPDARGKRLTLRADMDALPMQELNDADYTSDVPGVAHMCGHDAHTAILLGTGLALASLPSLPRGVRLLFQPAEEVMPGGALDVIASGVMSGVSRIFALHCDPRLEVGKVGVRTGAITSAADLIEIVFSSSGGHTSRPHLTSDLIYAMGTVITSLPGLLGRRVDPRSSTVMAWGAAKSGDAANAIPRVGVLRGTVRTGDHATWALLEPLVREIVASTMAPTGVDYEIKYRRGVPPVINDPESTAIFRAAVTDGDPTAITETEQSGGGEDFSWYLEHVPGAMGRLGVWSGEGPQRDLHQPTFDIDERALEVGVRVFTSLVLQEDLDNQALYRLG